MSTIKKIITKPAAKKTLARKPAATKNKGEQLRNLIKNCVVGSLTQTNINYQLAGDNNRNRTLNSRGRDGYTALMIAAERNDMAAVRALALNGAIDDIYEEVPKLMGYATTAAEIAISNGNMEMAEYISRNCGNSGLVFASNSGATVKLFEGIRKRDFAMVSEAIKDGADVNAFDNSSKLQETALTLCMFCYIPVEILHALLKAGADVNKPNGNGMSPLTGAAVRAVGEERINALMNHGARNEEDSKGRRPSDYAKIHCDYTTMMLIEEWKPAEEEKKETQ